MNPTICAGCRHATDHDETYYLCDWQPKEPLPKWLRWHVTDPAVRMKPKMSRHPLPAPGHPDYCEARENV